MLTFLFRNFNQGSFGFKEIIADDKEEAIKLADTLYPNENWEYQGVVAPDSTQRGPRCDNGMCGLTLPDARPKYTYDDDSPLNGG